MQMVICLTSHKRSTRYSLWTRGLTKLSSSINSSSNTITKLSMKNMEHAWRKLLSWDEFKEIFPAKTASTESAPVEASKVEVATTEGAEDGFLSDEISIVQPSPAMWLCLAHSSYIRTFVWFSCAGTLQLYRDAPARQDQLKVTEQAGRSVDHISLCL